MMNFSEWRQHAPGRLYLIVDAALSPSVVERFYATGGAEAFPLFAGTAFANQAQHGPWLLPFPSRAFIEAHSPSSGCYVVSDAPMESVRAHWQSLIEVAYEGEVMWLRFADHRVFPKILGSMRQSEIDDMLGPCASLWADGATWIRSPNKTFTPRQAPWLRIYPHHLTDLYDENRHAYILRRRLWQILPAIMARHANPERAIPVILHQSNQEGLDGIVRDGVVAGALAQQAAIPLDAIRTPLHLTAKELAQVANWLDKNHALIGESDGG